MPPTKKNFADRSKILLSLLDEITHWEGVKKIIDESRADHLRARDEMSEKLAAAKSEAAARGEKFNSIEFYENNTISYAHQDDAHILEAEYRRNRGCWVRYDLERFSGRDDLTASQKQAWRAEIRTLEAAGLVERDGHDVRLTEAGETQARALAEQSQ